MANPAVSRSELPIDFEKVRRASRAAGWGTLVGAVLVIGSLLYSGYQLGTTADKLTKAKAELAQVETDLATSKDNLEATKKDLANEAARLKKVRQDHAHALAKFEATTDQLNVARNDRAVLNEVLHRAVSTEELVRMSMQPAELIRVGIVPQATAEEIESSGGRQFYHFTLSIGFTSPEIKERLTQSIKSVTYKFNYPSLSDSTRTSAEADTGYATSYRGWGALKNVIIIVELEDGEKVPIDFDMTKALPGIPSKGGPIPIPEFLD